MHGRNEKNIKFSIRPHFELILVTHSHIIENVRPLYHANVISILLVEALSRKSINRHSRKISTWHSYHPVSLAFCDCTASSPTTNVSTHLDPL